MDPEGREQKVWDTPPYQCPWCEKEIFAEYRQLTRHCVDAVHLPNCKRCGDWFPSFSHALDHYFDQHRSFYHRRIADRNTRPRDKRKAKERLPQRNRGDRYCKYTDPNGIKPVQITERDLPVVTYLLGEACHSESRLEKHDFTLKSNLKSDKKKESKGFLDVKDFTALPDATKERVGKRDALVIDCEMVEGSYGNREVAYLSVIDFFSGRSLIDTFIEPRTTVARWNTRYSGVTEKAMNHAIRIGTSMTWESMRSTLEKICDTDTVLIGHALNNDLDVLGLLPSKVVDSSIHTSEAVFFNYDEKKRLPRIWGLKTLAKELLNHDIQTSDEGHSALEDVYATREVLFWSLMHPGDLRLWGIEKKRIEDELKAKQEAKAAEERQKKKKKEEEAAAQDAKAKPEAKAKAKSKGKGKGKAKAAKENKTGSTGKGKGRAGPGDESDDSWKGDN